MKKSVVFSTLVVGFIGAASAQSSVTISGGLDLGLVRQNGDTSMAGAGSARNALTFSGSEDLGGGMRAFFLLNHRFNPATGAQRDANAFFRQSWVGLGGGFGDVRLGKMLSPLGQLDGLFDAFGTETVGSTYIGTFMPAPMLRVMQTRSTTPRRRSEVSKFTP